MFKFVYLKKNLISIKFIILQIKLVQLFKIQSSINIFKKKKFGIAPSFIHQCLTININNHDCIVEKHNTKKKQPAKYEFTSQQILFG